MTCAVTKISQTKPREMLQQRPSLANQSRDATDHMGSWSRKCLPCWMSSPLPPPEKWIHQNPCFFTMFFQEKKVNKKCRSNFKIKPLKNTHFRLHHKWEKYIDMYRVFGGIRNLETIPPPSFYLTVLKLLFFKQPIKR